MSRITVMNVAFTRNLSEWFSSIAVRVSIIGCLETVHEAGCLPAIASCEGQLAFSVATNAVLS